jgi:hypothetical protein
MYAPATGSFRVARLPPALQNAIAAFLTARDILRLEALPATATLYATATHSGAARLVARALARCGGATPQELIRARFANEHFKATATMRAGAVAVCAALAIARAAAPLAARTYTYGFDQRVQLWVRAARRPALNKIREVDLWLEYHAPAFAVAVVAYDDARQLVPLPPPAPALERHLRRYPPADRGRWELFDCTQFAELAGLLLLLFGDRVYAGGDAWAGAMNANALRLLFGVATPIAAQVGHVSARRALLRTNKVQPLNGEAAVDAFGAGADS